MEYGDEISQALSVHARVQPIPLQDPYSSLTSDLFTMIAAREPSETAVVT